MIGRSLAAGLLLAAAGSALAQSVIYRCGNEYSRTPCSLARVVDTRDAARTEAQRAEAAHRPAAAGSLGPARPAASASAKAPAAGKSKGKKKDSSAEGEDFVAQVPVAKT